MNHSIIWGNEISLPVQTQLVLSPVNTPPTLTYRIFSAESCVELRDRFILELLILTFFYFLPARNRLLIIAFNLPGNHPHQIALFLILNQSQSSPLYVVELLLPHGF
ncbi:hypothetical protein CBFG_01282 [Clostridiales bacterium 1_7_47FAA]|nr:hypothetical protein CBFG_01282 [Clostridiales bacterium 1_7_47FAA]